MILVIAGSDIHSFERLFVFLDILASKGKIKDCLIQRGYTKYEPKYCRFVDFIPIQEIDKLVNQAEAVIVHGGVGAFFTCAKNGKMPIVVPRLASLKEHIDTSQPEFASALEERGLCRAFLCLQEEPFLKAIEEVKGYSLKMKDMRNSDMYKILNKFLEG